MINKQEYIQTLTNVKVVLGNGFDLHCGLRTTYNDFFRFNFKKIIHIKKLFDEYEKRETFNVNFSDPKNNLINTWDVFFALNKIFDIENKNWCDIERLIYSSLVPYDKDLSDTKTIVIGLGSDINWNHINSLIFSGRTATNYLDRFIVEFIKARAGFKGIKLNNFYRFLLLELKEFEKNFGEFIYRQFHIKYLETCNGGMVFLNTNYLNNAVYTINELANADNIVAIDSFNFSVIEKDSIKEKFHNINGTYESPIFGVDTRFSPEEPRYIFAKTSRRIDSDMAGETFDKKVDFSNLVIYGHSLNEADYSYFFPVFDKLNLLDSTATGVVVFAYSIYKEKLFEKIESELRMSISKIVLEYAKSKNIPNPERLLDSLSTQKRILTYKINTLSPLCRAPTEIDKDWEKIDKEIEEYYKHDVLVEELIK